MKQIVCLVVLVFTWAAGTGKNPQLILRIESPGKKTSISVVLKHLPDNRENAGSLFFRVDCLGKRAVNDSPLGITRDDAAFVTGLQLVSRPEVKQIEETYRLFAGKCSTVHNHAAESVLRFKNSGGRQLEVVLRAYDDGVAFRYRFPESDAGIFRVLDENTAFSVPGSGKAWIHPYDFNSRKKPSYEQPCEKEIPVGSPSPNEWGWAYPMLFNINGLWMMITEAVMDGTWCGTHLQMTTEGAYKVTLAEKDEVVLPDDPAPVHSLPWSSPWRVIMVGDNPATIVESNIVQNLNEPCRMNDTGWIKPGRASWSWWSEGGSPRNYAKLTEYVDFTARMGWEYLLVDAGWPEMKGGTIEEVIRYANSRNVGIWLWYHSGAGVPKDSVSVRNLMSVPEARRAEFSRLRALGVKGVKVDFFDTDKQGVVKLYKEILGDAAENQILVNFHGASLPRGMERTYPNLLTVEAVRGAEGLGRQERCDEAPAFNTILPFTRNVVGPMDYTPVTFSNKVRQGTEALQHTSYAFQLALSVIFQSGIQDFADNYRSYEALPELPLEFLKKVPAGWDETRLVAGYPGDFVVMARRKGSTWYVAGINGKDELRNLIFTLPFKTGNKKLNLITDGDERTSFSRVTLPASAALSVKVLPYGGFAGTLE
jgi:alpha-glucosidase